MTLLPKPPRRGPKPRKRIARGRRPRPYRKGPAADKRYAEHVRWRALVMAKNDGGCVNCWREATDPAHVYPKGRYKHVEHLPSNGLPLCRQCHDFYTPRQILWLIHAQGYMGQRAFCALRRRALELP